MTTTNRVNIMDLFNKAKQQPVPSMSLGSKTIEFNDRKILQGDDEFFMNTSETQNELPNFLSEVSAVSLLPSDLSFSKFDRLVAGGGQYLFLARGDALWVIDMVTGFSNDRSVPINTRPIRDMEFSSSASLLIFTDGIDVGIIKCAGINGSQVHLNPVIYLTGIGSVDDPVVSVQLHPTNTPSFVTIRESNGWTLWDLVRLQGRPSSSLDDISLFKTQVDDPVSEGTWKWSQSSDVLAGKKLSPGVLAILKRGSDVSPERSVSEQGARFKSFAFSQDGTLALASVGSKIRAWSIGPKCCTISVSKDIETIKEPVDCLVGVEDGKFACITESGKFFEFDSTNIFRRICLDNLTGKHTLKRILFINQSSGLRESLFVASGSIDNKTPVVVLISSDSIWSIPCEMMIGGIMAVVGTTTVGNPSQIALYIHGKDASGHVWAAQTIDTELMNEIYTEKRRDHFRSDYVETSPLVVVHEDSSVSQDGSAENDSSREEHIREEDEDDFPHSDVSEGPPERLESTVEFMNNSNKRIVEFRETIQRETSAVLEDLSKSIKATVETELAGPLFSRMQKFEKDTSQRIRKIVSDRFSEGMKSMMSEITTQVENRIEKRLNALLEVQKKETEANRLLMKKMEELVERMDGELERVKKITAAPPPVMSREDADLAVLSEIRKNINSGNHVEGISVAAQWWKQNQPGPGQQDLLPIACGAIVQQLRSPEPIADIASGCFVVLVLTEWAQLNANIPHPDRVFGVLRACKFILSCLFVSQINVDAETQDLCFKSLNRSIGYAAMLFGAIDRSLEDLARDVLSDIRELMNRFYVSSREATPRNSSVVPSGQSILHLVRR